MAKEYHCKTASLNDIKLMLSWAQAEGWNPGLNDATPFLVTDPTGFFMGFLDKIPIASLSAVRYPNHFGFMGFYIVAPQYRGQGFGSRLWEHGMKYLAGYTVGLDGVLSSQESYKKSGFSLAHKNLRFSGLAPNIKSKPLVNINELPFDLLLNYDRKLFPAARSSFLPAWFSMPDSKSLAVMTNNSLQGYGVIRKCQEGYKIGPLFAENFSIAEQLFLGLCEYAKQGPIFLDVPETNKDAMKLTEQYKLQPVFETGRMYTQTAPAINLNKVFGITTFELG